MGQSQPAGHSTRRHGISGSRAGETDLGDRRTYSDICSLFERINMTRPKPKVVTETKCHACGGTGFEKVEQPLQPNRKIFPPRCKECLGKGRIESQRPWRRCGDRKGTLASKFAILPL
jgi:DnaJ-class molecular chaperone